MYETAYEHLTNICHAWKKGLKDLGGKELAPPSQFALTKNNIGLWEQAILEAHKKQPGFLYSLINKLSFWGFMHDGISKFGKEFNGYYLRRIHPDKFTPFVVPYCLTQVKVGVTVWDLVNNIFETIARFAKVENSAFTNVKHYFSSQSTLPTPPPYFKLGTVLYVNDNEIHIKMSTKLPIGNCGDGVSIN